MRFFGWMICGAALLWPQTATPAMGQDHTAHRTSRSAVVDNSAALEREAFIQRARAASIRYKSLDAAIADGFRKVGPDVPEMGEHWVSIRGILRPQVDIDHPPVLTYLRIQGRPVLTGVAYAAVVSNGGALPPPPVQGASWHLHTGTVQEELLGHDHAAEGEALAMFHAWIWTENPSDTFAAENWSLPFVRSGAAVPAELSPEASKAASLVDSTPYYLWLIEVAEDGLPERRTQIGDLFAHYRLESEAIMQDLRNEVGAAGTDRRSEVERLEDVWRNLWQELRMRLSDETMRRLSHTIDGE